MPFFHLKLSEEYTFLKAIQKYNEMQYKSSRMSSHNESKKPKDD